MTQLDKDTPQFFLTAPQPCPYLPDKYERKVFTYIDNNSATDINSFLTQTGFRRSQNIAYRPMCDGCSQCVSTRIIVNDFKSDQTMRRIWRKNTDIIGKICPPKATSEQYSLFQYYLKCRHFDGGMTEMTMLDYQMMVEDTQAKVQIIEYRKRGIDSHITKEGEGELLGVALTDLIDDGLSMVYSFYRPELTKRSLGTFFILDHISRTRKAGLPFVYLGYWVKDSPKMTYKAKFLPQEHLTRDGWKRFVI